MKIVFVETTIDESLIGGGHTYLPKLARGLIQAGHEVHLVTKDTPDHKILPLLQACGIIIHSHIWSKRLLPENAAIKLAAWVNQLNPEIYIISTSPDVGWLALPLLHPHIATLSIAHTDSDTYYDPVLHYQHFLTAAVGVSNEICANFITKCGLKENQVCWIPYGVQVADAISKDANENLLELIYVGRIEEQQKRISDLVCVIKELERRKIPFVIKIIGDGPELPKLKTQLSELITINKVQLFGWVDESKVIEMLRSSVVFVLTSAYEGFCIALVEAMANGCCPVVTNLPSGNSQLIQHGHNGFLIDTGNVDGFANQLEWIFKNPHQLPMLRKNALEEGKKYSTGNMVLKYEAFFNASILLAEQQPRKSDPAFPILPSCRSAYPGWLRKIRHSVKSILN